MADFAQAVKWMQEGYVAVRELYPHLEYALEPCLTHMETHTAYRALVMRHAPDYCWEDPILIETDLTADDWQCKKRRKRRKGKSNG